MKRLRFLSYNPGMLTHLHISNIVLIDKLNLEFKSGLSVLTGETGAGKSILLDALSLALGARSDTGLIRHGTDAANVIAEFDVRDLCNANNVQCSALRTILDENEIDFTDGTLILRRTLSRDGKSRALVNDIPISVKVLKQIGDELVEIHGQFENHSLLDPRTHGTALDQYGGYNDLLDRVANTYREWHGADKSLRELREMLEKSAMERDFLEHNVRELSALKPIIGEEEELSTRRAAMMDAEKNTAILSDARDVLSGGGHGPEHAIFNAAHILERIKTDPNPYQAQIDRLYEMGAEISEIADAVTPTAIEVYDLEQTEERLFALRAVARKHRCSVDELAQKLITMTEQLNVIDDSESALAKLESTARAARLAFDAAATTLHDARVAATSKLRDDILAELPDLKLGSADFTIDIASGTPSARGTDDITFLIKTNPGSPFAPLHKIASGGELARLMLALRVVLSHGNANKTFIFDEVDTGISGGTASAVGARLARLATGGQAIVITHSAQVAGYGNTHYLIKKDVTDTDGNQITTTTVTEIPSDARITELARIISGAEITEEGIRLATVLLKS